MLNYKPNTSAKLTFSLQNEDGVFLTPTSLQWRVLDEAEAVLQDWTSVNSLPASSELEVTIPQTLTFLIAPAVRGIRTVEVEVTTASGTYVLTESVLIQGATALALGINTFNTYAQAMLESENYVPDNIAGWSGAVREDREKALIEAYRRIMMLPIGVHFDNMQSRLSQDAFIARNFGPSMLRDMTPEQIAGLHAPMLTDLRRAQIVEADEILNVDVAAQARNDGVTSITVGESSQTFKASKPLLLGASIRTINILQRWVRFGARIERR